MEEDQEVDYAAQHAVEAVDSLVGGAECASKGVEELEG